MVGSTRRLACWLSWPAALTHLAQLACALLVLRLILARPVSSSGLPRRSRVASQGAKPTAIRPPWHACAADGAARLCGVNPAVRVACFGDGDRTRTFVQHTLLVGVRDRTAALLRVLPSWLAVHELDEIVLVDWGSPTPLQRAQLPLDARLRLVTAPHEREWNLARAYNLAAQFARGAVLLKVGSTADGFGSSDCH